MNKKTKVADLTIEEFKGIIRQVIKEEIPVLTTINPYSQKNYYFFQTNAMFASLI